MTEYFPIMWDALGPTVLTTLVHVHAQMYTKLPGGAGFVLSDCMSKVYSWIILLFFYFWEVANSGRHSLWLAGLQYIKYRN